MIELRWVVYGQCQQLEYRYLLGKDRRAGEWSNWAVVPMIEGTNAQIEELRGIGGVVGVP